MKTENRSQSGSGPAQMVVGIVAITGLISAAAVAAAIFLKRRQEDSTGHWMSRCDKVASKIADKLKVYDIAS